MHSSDTNSDYPGVKNKLFLVTGASSGIGRETARLLDRLGARVILNGRNTERIEETLNMMQGKAHIISATDLLTIDIRQWLSELLQPIEMKLAGLAHCAGTHIFAPLRGFSSDALSTAFHESPLLAARIFHGVCMLRHREKHCSLVSMTSISSQFGIIGNGNYGAARAALESISRSFAIEFASHGIRCNTVSGGFMLGSGMTSGGSQLLGSQIMDKMSQTYPLGLGQVEDAANAIVFLLGTASRWITGTTLTVDGGISAKGA